MDAIKLYTLKLTRRVQSMSSRSCTKPKQTCLTCFWKGSWMIYDPEHWGRNRSRGSQVLYCVITSLDLSGGGPPNWPTASHGLVAKSSYSLCLCAECSTVTVPSSVILQIENSTVILSAATKGDNRAVQAISAQRPPWENGQLLFWQLALPLYGHEGFPNIQLAVLRNECTVSVILRGRHQLCHRLCIRLILILSLWWLHIRDICALMFSSSELPTGEPDATQAS